MNRGHIVTICVFGGISMLYFMLIQIRRLRWKAMASALGATYVSMGLFQTGRIEGETGGRKFIVGTDVRLSGVMVPFAYAGIPLGLPMEFFSAFPDWRHALTVGDNRQRCFVTHVTFKSVSVLLPEQYRDEVKAVFSELRRFFPPSERRIGKGCLWLRPEGAEFKFAGLTFDAERIKTIVAMLSRAVDIAETNPIMESAEQDESTVPVKAAPSASFPVR